MKIEAKLKFITPCFCTGADRLKAEIRAPSIRGELRWWFRCLGGTTEDERNLFGGMAGVARSSAVRVRVFNIQRAESPYAPTHAKLEDPGSYIHYFLDQPPKDAESRLWITPPNRTTGKKGVPRPESCLPPNSTFNLILQTIRPLEDAQERLLQLAVNAMLQFGSLGYRHTRGFGAWSWEGQTPKRSELDHVANQLKQVNSGFEFWFAPSASNNLTLLLNQVETKLKAMRKPGNPNSQAFPAKEKTALGYSHGKNQRQTSAVRFRPVEFKTARGDSQFTLCILQAPDQILGTEVVDPKRLVPAFVPR